MWLLWRLLRNYSVTSGSSWNYYRDEIDDVDDNTSGCKSFEYKTRIIRNTPERPGNEGAAKQPPVPTLNVEVTSPLNCLI